ncbi:unnamed protein product [Spirodela intermedia]|uniref:RRM domain-containing protein n=1 Tax=Spirodela intermedia TaxID=51605 RepID=A0A7I8IEF9_SPIIN|nr:unnamed protein product [Spirodela intermedia]CAA6655483.1 unnamed protein product [Spirodela intermedia]
MSYQKEVRYTSHSLSPLHRRSRSRSMSRDRSRSRSRDSATANNPGNNLYVTGLSTRVTSSDLEKYFNKEGKVVECHVVTDPRTRESRGFGFVTMGTLEDANRCVKYLNRSVLEGRLITVEKAKRKRARTPTPGNIVVRGKEEVCIDLPSDDCSTRRRSRSYSPYRSRDRGRSRSRERSRSRDRSRSRNRSRSRGRRERSRSPYRKDAHRRQRDRSRSPGGRGNSRSD